MHSAVLWVRRHDRAATAVALALICLFGFTLRVWNLDWDEGTHQHPDERFWSIVTDSVSAPRGPVEYFDSASSPLNPYNHHDTFVYGTFPLFATKAVAAFLHEGPPPAGAIVTTLDAVGVDLRDGEGRDRFDAGYGVNLVGRLASAVLDTATIAVVFALGATLFGRRVGLVAALLAASTVLHIQYSHFHGGEIWATFFTTVVVLGSVHLARRPGTRLAAGVGAALGAALASKFTAVAAVAVPVVAIAVWLAPDARIVAGDLVARIGSGPRRPDLEVTAARRRSGAALVSGLMLIIAAGVTFRVLQPYAFDGLGLDARFRSDLDYIRDVNAGGNVPWVVQWIGVTPLVHPVATAFWWGMGPALGLAVVTGTWRAVADVVRRRRMELLVPLSLLVVLLGLVSRQFNPLIRYLLPGYPVAIVLAGYGVVWSWDRFRDRRPAIRRAARVVPAALVGLTVVYALAFTNGVYGSEHPRLAASRWMEANLAPGSVLTSQVWDDRLPLDLPDTDPGRFGYVSLDGFQPSRGGPAGGTVEEVVAALDQADYVVEASNKVYDAVVRFPARYPVTVQYFDALFDGRLGFEEVARFRTRPSLFGVGVDTSSAEETFSVYDHPTVIVWQKTDEYASDDVRSVLNADAAAVAVDLRPSEGRTNALLLTPDEAAAQQGGGTWREVFDPDGITSHWSWLWWLAWLQVASLAAVPWVTLLFRRMPDLGYPLAKVLGLAAVAGPVWVIVAWGVADFSARLVWVWSGVVLAIGAVLGHRRRAELAEAFRAHRRGWLTAEALFVAAFLGVVALRSANPDLWHPWYGGEKPMEVAYLTAIARSTTLPAFDPWFGGGAMNYYYGGWFALAVPIRALRIVPEVAFNLGLATFAAMAATVTYSTVGNLVALGRRARGPHGHDRDGADGARSGVPIGFGLLGAGMLLLAGNLDAVRIQAKRLWTSVTGGTPPPYDWWAPSRVNHGLFDITEFPYWSLLYGDLHPHVMGIAVLGLVVAVGLAYVVSARAGDLRRSVVLAAGLGLVTGAVRVVHTWDLPAAIVLGAGLVLLGQLTAPDRPLPSWLRSGRDDRPLLGLGAMVLLAAGGSGGLPPDPVSAALVALGAALLVATLGPGAWRPRIARTCGHVLVAALFHVVVFWPYLRDSEVYDSGLVAAPVTTPLSGFVRHWGLFLVPIAALLVLLLVRRLRSAEHRSVPHAMRRRAVGSAAILAAVVAAGLVGGVVAALCAVGVVAAAAVVLTELRRPTDADVSLVVAVGLAALGLGIVGGVDVVTVVNDIERMNTVFKFWYAAWHLLAIAAAYAIWRSWVELSAAARAAAGNAARYRRRRRVRRSWTMGVTGLLVVSLTYPVVATRPRLDQRFAAIPATLDGLAYLDTDPVLHRDGASIALADDLVIVEWLRANVTGSPVIAEATGPLYDWTSRVSVMTGLPTVIGWDHHQRQQRRGVAHLVDQRVADTAAFFSVADAELARSYLRRYGVSYVVVGTMERRMGSAEALDALDALPFLTPVLREGGSVIYEVERPLGPGPG